MKLNLVHRLLEWEIKKWWQVPLAFVVLILLVPVFPFLLLNYLFYDK